MTARSPSAGNSILLLGRAMLLNFLRDRTALFFTFLFPLMFLIVFGIIFSDSNSNRTVLAVVGDGPLLRKLPSSILEITPYPTLDKATAAVKAGDVPAVAVQDGDRLLVRYAASDQVQAATIRGVLGAVVAQENVSATGKPPKNTLVATQIEDESLPTIQFLTGGILSWGVASSAIFGATLTIVSWRRKQILRRVRLSPAPVWTIIGARVGVSLLVAAVQAIVYFAVALTPPFGLQLSAQTWLVIPLLISGTLAFLAIGLLVGAIAKTEESGNAMANFVVLPMAFLSGTFFNISGAPVWFQILSKILPLRHLNDGMVGVLARGQGIESVIQPCAILLGFAAVLFGVAVRVFRWDDI